MARRRETPVSPPASFLLRLSKPFEKETIMPEDKQNADTAMLNSIEAITTNIAGVVVKQVEDNMFDPFALGMKAELDKMKETLEVAKEGFRTNVLQAVRESRRKLIEERVREFNVGELIKKFTDLPTSISTQNRKVKAAIQTRDMLKKQYEVALINLSTIAAQGGLMGQNAEDRKAITGLLEDAVENIDKYEEVVNINYQSTAKDKLSLGVKDLGIATARNAYKKYAEIENEVVETQIILEELHNTFSALKRIVNLISAVSA